MPNHPKLDEWQQRIEQLCSQIVKRPELTWLWEIRIKILMYLIHRYGESATSQPEVARAIQHQPSTTLRPQPIARQSPCAATRRTQIHTLLQSIHRVNCESKAARAMR